MGAPAFLAVALAVPLRPSSTLTVTGTQLPGAMLTAMFVGLITFSLVYAYFVRMRLNINRLEEQIKREASK